MNDWQINPSLPDIYNKLKSLEKKKLKNVSIRILRNITIHPIEPYIKFYCSNFGFNSSLNHGNYDAILQDANNISEDITVIFLTLENFSQNLTYNFHSISEEQIKIEINHIINYIEATIASIRKVSQSPIILADFIEPTFNSFGLLDHSMLEGEKHSIQKLNIELRNMVSKKLGVFILPISQLAGQMGHNNFFDTRQWYISKLPYSKDGLREIAKTIAVFINGLQGNNKKCLVLDCDNVLWGGILGEDGGSLEDFI